jgi:hypothetical protein
MGCNYEGKLNITRRRKNIGLNIIYFLNLEKLWAAIW